MKIYDTIKAFFKDGKIEIEGKVVSGFFRISTSELMDMYRGNTGHGVLNLDVKEPEKKE